MVSSLPRCPLLSCQFVAISLLISLFGGMTYLWVNKLLYPQCSLLGLMWIGRCFSHCFISSFASNCTSTIQLPSYPSESVSKILMNALSGMSVISQLSSTMSAPFGRDSVSAGVFVFS
jgi:hypothetical protein